MINAFPKTYLTILPLAPDQTAGKALLGGLNPKAKAKGKAKAKAKSSPENGRGGEKASWKRFPVAVVEWGASS